MACRVGITTDPEERKRYWRSKYCNKRTSSMSNLTVYRNGFMLSLAIVLLTFGLQGVGYCQADSTADPELSVNHIYDKVIRLKCAPLVDPL